MKKKKTLIAGWSLKDYYKKIQNPFVIYASGVLILGIISLLPFLGWIYKIITLTTLYVGGTVVIIIITHKSARKDKASFANLVALGIFTGILTGLLEAVVKSLEFLLKISSLQLIIAAAASLVYIFTWIIIGLIIGMFMGLVPHKSK